MNRTMPATLTGLILGLTLVFRGFGDMLIVALVGLVGFGIAKVLDGDLDLSQLSSRRRSDR